MYQDKKETHTWNVGDHEVVAVCFQLERASAESRQEHPHRVGGHVFWNLRNVKEALDID